MTSLFYQFTWRGLRHSLLCFGVGYCALKATCCHKRFLSITHCLKSLLGLLIFLFMTLYTRYHSRCRFQSALAISIRGAVMKEGVFRRIAPAFSNKLHPCSVLLNRSNEEVMLLKRFFDGFKRTLSGVK